MAKSNITRVQPNATAVAAATQAVTQLPDYLQGKEVKGVETMREYVVLPRLKIVQKQSNADNYPVGIGGLCIMPTAEIVADIERDTKGTPVDKGQPIFITPVFFFVDWATWNPYELKGTEPSIVDRTADRNHPIAVKSRDAKTRFEEYKDDKGNVRNDAQGKPLQRKHIETLNFVCVQHLPEGRLSDPFIVGYSSAEHFTGKKFSTLIQSRNASLFACVFQAQAVKRPPRKGNDWYGVEMTNPPVESSQSPWVTADQLAALEDLHTKMAHVFKSQGIRADETDIDTDIPSGIAPDDIAPPPADRQL